MIIGFSLHALERFPEHQAAADPPHDGAEQLLWSPVILEARSEQSNGLLWGLAEGCGKDRGGSTSILHLPVNYLRPVVIQFPNILAFKGLLPSSQHPTVVHKSSVGINQAQDPPLP